MNGSRDKVSVDNRKSLFEVSEQQIVNFMNEKSVLNRLIKNTQMNIIVWYSDGTLAWCNEHAWATIGLAEEGLNGTIDINSIIPQDVVCHIKEKLDCMEDNELHYRSEDSLVFRSGKEIYTAWNHFMIRDNGRTGCIVSIGTDITSLKSDGKNLAEVNSNLAAANEKYFNNNMIKKASLQNEIMKDLRAAITNGEFFLCYQPLIDIKTKKIASMEALIRWRHSRKGIVNPMEFIPVAEEMGLIIPIGEWVLHTACRQLKEWNSLGYRDLGISVNVSTIQLQQHDFSEIVSKVLEETGLPPQCLELEITESVLIESTRTVAKNLSCLKKQGVKISIDDFGTGYSCLEYLQKLSVNSLKIDKTFIWNIKVDVNKAIVDTVITLGHKLNMEITAEGVETEEQYYYLKDKGCDKVQGYYFSKPLLPEELIEFLRASNN